VNVQVAAAWVTVTARPAIVTVPVRPVVAVFAAATTVAVPFPEPVEPVVIDSHEAPLDVFQPHPLPALTVTVNESPAAGELRTVGAIVYEHGVEPAWFTVSVRPAIVMVPVRDDDAVFAATAIETLPLPEPAEPAVTVSHDAAPEVFHAHPLPAVTVTVNDSPAAGELRVAGAIA
jgi:hypothetical protein